MYEVMCHVKGWNIMVEIIPSAAAFSFFQISQTSAHILRIVHLSSCNQNVELVTRCSLLKFL